MTVVMIMMDDDASYTYMVFSAYQALFSRANSLGTVIVPTFQMRNERQRKMKKLAQGHRADGWQSRDFNVDSWPPSPVLRGATGWGLRSLWSFPL